MISALLILATLLIIPASANAAERIEGKARIVDGDTVSFSVRLAGIDTPETRQKCKRADGTEYGCGKEATRALREKIANQQIYCKVEKKLGAYGRYIGVCYTKDGEDLNAWMMRAGWGAVNPKYSKRYAKEEKEAREAKRGIWQGSFIPPWEWRRGKREVDRNKSNNVSAPGLNSSAVKKSRSGICHCPGGRSYSRTKRFTPYQTIKACFESGGRHPKRGQGKCSK